MGLVLVDKDGYHLLHEAAEHGHAALVPMLVEYFPNALNAQLNKVVLERSAFPIDYSSIAHIQDHCSRQRSQNYLMNKGKSTAMHLAARKGYFDVLEVLLQAGAFYEVRDQQEAAPLHYACAVGSLECVKVLLKAQADPALVDECGRNALDCAKMGCNEEIIRLLKDHELHANGRIT